MLVLQRSTRDSHVTLKADEATNSGTGGFKLESAPVGHIYIRRAKAVNQKVTELDSTFDRL
jgi:hypothetical protein